MRKIIVPIDFSRNSRAGARFALQLARQSKARLVFYHVVELTKPRSWTDWTFDRFAREKIGINTEKLKRMVKELNKGLMPAADRTQYVVELNMDPTEAAISYARRSRASAICLSTHGASGLAKVMGTHAGEIVRKSPTPVIVVPAKSKVRTIKNILYATDLSETSRELTRLRRLFQPIKPRLLVYHYDYLIQLPENRKALELKAQRFSSKDVKFVFDYRDIESSLKKDLAKTIEAERPDMLALFTRERHFEFSGILPGSEAMNFVFEPLIPVVVFKKAGK